MMKVLVFSLLASLAVPALAQGMPMVTAVCPRDAEPIPAGLAGWSNRTPMTAANDAASVGQANLVPGVAVDLALAGTPAVQYVVRPSHPGGSVSHGGMAGLVIATAGTYRVAIGSGAWVDLIKDKTSLESVGHDHGPNCSGIRKMVDFALQPGSYILQVAGNGEARIPVLVAKLP